VNVKTLDAYTTDLSTKPILPLNGKRRLGCLEECVECIPPHMYVWKKREVPILVLGELHYDLIISQHTFLCFSSCILTHLN
jgi:hypothetical protein